MINPNRNPDISYQKAPGWQNQHLNPGLIPDSSQNQSLDINENVDTKAFWDQATHQVLQEDYDVDEQTYYYMNAWKDTIFSSWQQTGIDLNNIFTFNKSVNQYTRSCKKNLPDSKIRFEPLSLMYRNDAEFDRVFSEKKKYVTYYFQFMLMNWCRIILKLKHPIYLIYFHLKMEMFLLITLLTA